MKQPVARRPNRSRTAGDSEPLLQELRSALANLRSAAEALDVASPRRAKDRRGELLRVVLEEAERASEVIARWSALEASAPGERKQLGVAVLARDVGRRARAACDLLLRPQDGLELQVEIAPDLVAALVATLGRLRRDFAVGEVNLSAVRHGSLVALDFSWLTSAPETALLRESHVDLLGGESGSSEAGSVTSLREAARASGGEAWIALARGGEAISLRVLLKRAQSDSKSRPSRR